MTRGRGRQPVSEGRGRDGGGSEGRDSGSGPARPDPPRGGLVAGILSAGVVAGFLESLPHRLAGAVGIPIHLTPHYVWTIPILDALLFLAVIGTVVLLGRRVSRLARREVRVGLALGMAAFFVLLTVEPLHDLAALFLAAGVGVQGARMAGGRILSGTRRALPAAAVVVLGAGALQGGATAFRQGRAGTSGAGDAPNVVLLILDTVRARSMGPWGAGPGASPEMDRLAREAVTFRWAVSPSPWTLPAHASLFTGRWPQELSAGWTRPLDGSHPTLAEVMTARGYRTGGFVGNLLQASHHTGLDRGFQVYRDFPLDPGTILFTESFLRSLVLSDPVRRLVARHELVTRKDAPEVNREFFDWVDAGDGPFFAFLNYFDAHEPLHPPGVPARDWNRYVHRGGVMYGENAWVEEKWEMDPLGVDRLRAAYAQGVARTDAGVGALIRGLRERGLLERTLLVVAGDHGEQLGENGLFDHSNSVYPVLLHVPLMVRGPGVPKGVVVEEAVSLRDLAATLLEETGGRPGSLPGRSLAETWRAAGPEGASGLADPVTPGGTGDPDPGTGSGVTAPSGEILGHLTRGTVEQPDAPIARGPGSEMHTLVDFPLQYIRNGDGTDEVVDWLRDPDATTNRAADPTLRDRIVELRSRLYARVTGQVLPDSVPLEPARVPYVPGRR